MGRLIVGDAGFEYSYPFAGQRDNLTLLAARSPRGGLREPRQAYVLWSVMALAVVALGALALRLSRREPQDPPAKG